MTINFKKHTIEMTKKFAAAAAKFGTQEYNDLQEARRHYPSYKVVTIAHKTGKSSFKGLNYEYMKSYIEKHDDENKTIMATFDTLTGKSEEAKEMRMNSASYIEVKKWFLKQFPEIEKFHETRKNLLAA